MFYTDKKRVLKFQLEKAAKEYADYKGHKEYTKEDLLEVLFGDEFSNEFYVYWWENPYEKEKTVWNRLNWIWFLPVFYIVFAPYQWITKGQIGFDQRTKFGNMVLKMLGEDK